MNYNSADYTIDLRKLRLLSELDQRGTITAAAAALNLTPSAVSQQIANLARELDVPLLEHRGRSVSLTGQARVLLTHLESMREQVARTRAALASWSDGKTGQVRVGSLASGITSVLAPTVEVVRNERPGLEIRVLEAEPEDAVARLDRGELDIAIAVDYPGGPRRDSQRFHRVDLINDVMEVALSSRHPLAAAKTIELSQLSCDDWVGAAPKDTCSQLTMSACASAGFAPDVRHYCNGWDAVAALVAAGAGVALIPRLAQPLHRDGLAVRPLAGEPVTRVLFALVRSGTQTDPGVTAILSALEGVATATIRRQDGASAENARKGNY